MTVVVNVRKRLQKGDRVVTYVSGKGQTATTSSRDIHTISYLRRVGNRTTRESEINSISLPKPQGRSPHLMTWLSRILLTSAGAAEPSCELSVKAELMGAKTVIPLDSLRSRGKFGSTDSVVETRVDKSLIPAIVVETFPGIVRTVGMT